MTLIIDDFSKHNLNSLTNYTSGTEFVRNYVIFEGGQNTYGFNYVYFSGSATLDIYVGTTKYTVTGTMKTISDAINTSTALRDSGLYVNVVSDFNGHADSLLITTTGVTEFKEYNFALLVQSEQQIAYGSATSPPAFPPVPSPPNILDYEIQHNSAPVYIEEYAREYVGVWISIHQATTNVAFTLAPYNDNQFTTALDKASILEYGTRIHTVKNIDLINTSIDKKTLLNNKLAELKDPKARCFVDIPFDYHQPKELDTVEVRLGYENQGRFRDFKEGGHFMSWEDSGTYRFKQFYIVGITHAKDGTHTRLRLMEKL